MDGIRSLGANGWLRAASAVVIGMALLSAGSSKVSAQTYSVVYSFPGGTSGAFPFGTISRDIKGNIYGTTYNLTGGSGYGLVYRIDPTGVETILHTFLGPPSDGGGSQTGVIHNTGVIYGTTNSGGTSGNGTVYTVTLGGKETVLHSFAGGKDGATPVGLLVLDTSLNIYGMTEYGGTPTCGPSGCGTIFKVTQTGQEAVAHRFSGPDGSYPMAGLLVSGNVGYGTTSAGGTFGNGTVFKITSTGKFTSLYSFGAMPDGRGPAGPVIRDTAGNTYGTTYYGGTAGEGTVFKIDTTGHESVLYSFTGGADGGNPMGTLAIDPGGNLFGTTYAGGQGIQGGNGVIFEVDTTGHESVIHAFAGAPDGQNPYGGLQRDVHGNLYGATVYGGTSAACGVLGCGTVFTAHP